MPVFWFSVSFINQINWLNLLVAFVILHLLVYPSSNGYNCYMDRDDDSIGGIEKPPKPTVELFRVTIVLDVMAIGLSFFISLWFALGILVYIGFSRLYSYRGVRLKKYPIAGYLTVIANQGVLTFFIVFHGASGNLLLQMPWQGLTAAGFLIGGFYPITQVYQHVADKKDGVTTISMLLGKRGTFVFCGLMYIIAFAILFFYYQQNQQMPLFILIQIFFIPVIVYFIRWLYKVWQNEQTADFKHTMQMNWLASTCTSLAFITIIILHQIG